MHLCWGTAINIREQNCLSVRGSAAEVTLECLLKDLLAQTVKRLLRNAELDGLPSLRNTPVLDARLAFTLRPGPADGDR